MKKLINKLDSKLLSTMHAIKNFASNERGDTNFISIAVILVVVIALAVVFIAFGDELGALLENAKNNLFDALG